MQGDAWRKSGINGQGRRFRSLAVVLSVATILGPARTARAQERISIDRWLVAAPASDSSGSPSASGAAPDRGQKMGSASWTLVRRDSASLFAIPAPEDATARPDSAWAHAYIRVPEDRDVRLAWGGEACGRIQLRLNGRLLRWSPAPGEARDDSGGTDAGEERQASADTVLARLGRGWNTLLLAIPRAGCSADYFATILPASAEGLAEVRVQASRPPGDVGVGPQPWVSVAPAIRVTPELRWTGERLEGFLAAQLTAWGRGPPDSVRLRARASGVDARTVRSLSPDGPTPVLFPVAFRELRKAARGGEGRLETRWDDEKITTSFRVDAKEVLRAFHGRIELAGWTDGPGAGEPGAGASDGGPSDGSGVRSGRWTVPGELAGFTLSLDVAAAPGAYRSGELPLTAEGGRLVLCDPCRKGETLDLSVAVAGEWDGPPAVSVLDPGYPDAAGRPGSPAAAEWLDRLDDRGGERYRELGRRLTEELEPSSEGDRE